MRKTIIPLALFVLKLLILSFVGVQTVEAAYTPGGAGFPLASGIDIKSPANTTYVSNLLMLNITVRSMISPKIYCYAMVYSVDGKNNVTIPVASTFVPIEATRTYPNGTTATVISAFCSYYSINGCVELPELSEGSHSLTVYARYDRISDENTNWPELLLDNNTIQFTINKETTANNVTVDSELKSNKSTAEIADSGTNVSACQPMTWQTENACVFAGLLVVGIIIAAIIIVLKRRSRTH
jgi:hypothetical protein